MFTPFYFIKKKMSKLSKTRLWSMLLEVIKQKQRTTKDFERLPDNQSRLPNKWLCKHKYLPNPNSSKSIESTSVGKSNKKNHHQQHLGEQNFKVWLNEQSSFTPIYYLRWSIAWNPESRKHQRNISLQKSKCDVLYRDYGTIRCFMHCAFLQF